MAVIENACTSPEALAEWRSSMRGMDRAELMAQQLVQRGAEHALAALQGAGVTPENCASMLSSLREGLIEIHAVAGERGIPLVDYSAPPASAAPCEDEPAAHQHGAEVSAFTITVSDNRYADDITVQRAKQISGPPLWKVSYRGSVLNRHDEWEHEPMPSSRTDEFLARCRFASAEEAIAAALAAKGEL